MTFHIDEDIAPIAEQLLRDTARAQAGFDYASVPEPKRRTAAEEALDAAMDGSDNFLEVVRDVSEWLWAGAAAEYGLGAPDERHIKREQRLLDCRKTEPRELECALAVGLYGQRERYNVIPLASQPVRNWLTHARGLILHRMNEA